jgi:hypothetical protein
MHSYRRDLVQRPIWLRLYLPARLAGLAAGNVRLEDIRSEYRRLLTTAEA